MRARAFQAAIGVGAPGWKGYVVRGAGRVLSIAAISIGLLWLVWIYASGLRDPRYLDGWVLASGMVLQIMFHIARSTNLSPKSAARWRKIHIFAGYLLIAAFISHSDFGLPDSGFEWALWTGFVLVTLSGIFGTYLAWSLQAKRRIDQGIGYERIPALRAELEQRLHAVIEETDDPAAAIDLPGLPYNAWIRDLYASHLKDYFGGQRDFSSHLIGSQRPLKHMTDIIDSLARYVDQRHRDKLAVIKNLVAEKHQLDFARVYLGLNRGWLFVHVPIAYGLIALTVVHIIVSYSFSSGVW